MKYEHGGAPIPPRGVWLMVEVIADLYKEAGYIAVARWTRSFDGVKERNQSRFVLG